MPVELHGCRFESDRFASAKRSSMAERETFHQKLVAAYIFLWDECQENYMVLNVPGVTNRAALASAVVQSRASVTFSYSLSSRFFLANKICETGKKS
jgi:hypothetical protein